MLLVKYKVGSSTIDYTTLKCSYSNFNICQLLPRPRRVHAPLAQINDTYIIYILINFIIYILNIRRYLSKYLQSMITFKKTLARNISCVEIVTT